LTFQTYFIIVFDLTLKQKCVKQYKKLKYNSEIYTKYQINLTNFDVSQIDPNFQKFDVSLFQLVQY